MVRKKPKKSEPRVYDPEKDDNPTEIERHKKRVREEIERWKKFIEKIKVNEEYAPTPLLKEQKEWITSRFVKKGFFLHGYFPCEKCPFKDQCEFYDGDYYTKPLPDGREVKVPKTCKIEKFIDTVYREKFKNEYKLDSAADKVLLDSIILLIIRIYRINKYMSNKDTVYPKIVPVQTEEGVKDVVTWELRPEEKILDRYIKHLTKLLNELAVSKKAREGSKVHIQQDVSILLSDVRKELEAHSDQGLDYEEVPYWDEKEEKWKTKWVKKKKVGELG